MSVSLPDTEDLDIFSHDATDIYTEEQKVQAIQQAGDLWWLATGETEDPDDEAVARIVQWGLLDMAWKLLLTTENKTVTYTPYSSERIGSYSYSKMQTAAQKGEGTGVEWFDAATRLVTGADEADSSIWLETEDVFRRPFSSFDAPQDEVVWIDWFGQ